MEVLEKSIEAYELQLKQVSDALLATGGDASQNDDLISLKNDLEQLISLTKQNLFELKKEELLKELESYNDSPRDDEKKGASKPSEQENRIDSPKENTEVASDMSSLEGVKCQAPFKSINSAKEFYHNAIIFAVNNDLVDETSYENLSVKVVFSNPTCQKMIPCSYYLEGKCNFSKEHCRHSHGEDVSLAKLKEFREPDYTIIKEGIGVLAKDHTSGLWTHANVEGVENESEKGMIVHVRFSRDSKTISSLLLEDIIPLNEDSDGDSDSDDGEVFEKGKYSSIGSNDIDNVRKVMDKIDGSVSALGNWESHTRGIGSKLMASMGYVHGTGLGKLSEGRVEPVPIMIYPSGCSIDYCMNIKEKYGNSESSKNDMFSAEKVLEKARIKEEKKNLRKLQKEKNRQKREKSFFDLLNSKLVKGECSFRSCVPSPSMNLSKKNMKRDSHPGSSKDHSKGDKAHEKALKVEGLKTFDEIQRKEREIERLEKSLNRVKDSGDRNILRQKLEREKNSLRHLKSREKSINKEQSKNAGRRKLEIF